MIIYTFKVNKNWKDLEQRCLDKNIKFLLLEKNNDVLKVDTAEDKVLGIAMVKKGFSRVEARTSNKFNNHIIAKEYELDTEGYDLPKGKLSNSFCNLSVVKLINKGISPNKISFIHLNYKDYPTLINNILDTKYE